MVDYPTKGIIASQLLGGYVQERNFNWNASGETNGYDEEGIQQGE